MWGNKTAVKGFVVSRSGAGLLCLEGSGKEYYSDNSKVCFLRCTKTIDNFKDKFDICQYDCHHDLLLVRNFYIQTTLCGYFCCLGLYVSPCGPHLILSGLVYGPFFVHDIML